MLINILLIIFGFILLVIGADWLVKGSKNIAKRFYIPEILIGLTIVAIGTSMPELIVTITSANKGLSDLIIGNAIGSNLCNILFILGITAILKPIIIDKNVRNIHTPISFFSTISLIAMSFGLFGSEKNIISQKDGTILFILGAIYLMYPIIVEFEDVILNFKQNKGKKAKKINIFLSLIYIVLGIILLKYGGDFVVDNATKIARLCNVSDRVIGLTIVAIGTALPEFITSIVAIISKDADLAVGNLIGSCILNILFILGIGAMITPLAMSKEFIQNLILSAFSLMLVWIFNFIGKRNTITRGKGIILVLIFVVYIINL